MSENNGFSEILYVPEYAAPSVGLDTSLQQPNSQPPKDEDPRVVAIKNSLKRLAESDADDLTVDLEIKDLQAKTKLGIKKLSKLYEEIRERIERERLPVLQPPAPPTPEQLAIREAEALNAAERERLVKRSIKRSPKGHEKSPNPTTYLNSSR